MKTRIEFLWAGTDDHNQPVTRAMHFDVDDNGRLHEAVSEAVQKYGHITDVKTYTRHT